MSRLSPPSVPRHFPPPPTRHTAEVSGGSAGPLQTTAELALVSVVDCSEAL